MQDAGPVLDRFRKTKKGSLGMKMIIFLSLTSILMLSGCVINKDLSPPIDSKSIKISVIKPVDVDILPMDVIYRSEKCRDKIFTSSMEITTRAGYRLLEVPFESEFIKNIVSGNVALHGGGQCEWKISNLRFQFKFKDMKHFGPDIKKNIPNDIVFVFDENSPPRGNGHYEDVSGDITIEYDFYPLIISDQIIDHAKTLSLESEKLLTFKVHNAGNILFKPHVHSNKVTTLLGPKEISGKTISNYPDGTKTIKMKGSYPLDFKKLKSIK